MSAKTMPTASSSLSNPARKKCTACAFSNGSNNGSGLFFKGEQTMDKRPGCEYCSKPAIGIQSLGCCVSYVCEDHADALLLALKPGEKKAYEECYLERFADP